MISDDEDTLEMTAPVPDRRTASGSIEVGPVTKIPAGTPGHRACPLCGSRVVGTGRRSRGGWVFVGTCEGCRQGVRTEHREG